MSNSRLKNIPSGETLKKICAVGIGNHARGVTEATPRAMGHAFTKITVLFLPEVLLR